MIPRISMPMPSSTSDSPKLRAGAAPLSTPASFSLLKNVKMVKPKLMSDSAVRMTAISVRSAAMRVRWNAMPVRRIASSVVADAGLGAQLNASVTPLPDDAAEADVARRGIDGLGVACRRTVAATVIGRAQVRAALQHLARDADVRLAAVVAALLRRAARILRRATGAYRR